ncbi:hypothetical protein Glove_99g307 [Diversispora epigaea]|uniref:Uncharacterized protein n=1 Tax=Diversispora epigaea TaxID=1348612 RepID=A0A397J8J2_9GLOM|nr:hypothetical protein Glove_99g307 [Diversispora epigaea]
MAGHAKQNFKIIRRIKILYVKWEGNLWDSSQQGKKYSLEKRKAIKRQNGSITDDIITSQLIPLSSLQTWSIPQTLTLPTPPTLLTPPTPPTPSIPLILPTPLTPLIPLTLPTPLTPPIASTSLTSSTNLPFLSTSQQSSISNVLTPPPNSFSYTITSSNTLNINTNKPTNSNTINATTFITPETSGIHSSNNLLRNRSSIAIVTIILIFLVVVFGFTTYFFCRKRVKQQHNENKTSRKIMRELPKSPKSPKFPEPQTIIDFEDGLDSPTTQLNRLSTMSINLKNGSPMRFSLTPPPPNENNENHMDENWENVDLNDNYSTTLTEITDLYRTEPIAEIPVKSPIDFKVRIEDAFPSPPERTNELGRPLSLSSNRSRESRESLI